jgi:hypothetical protein
VIDTQLMNDVLATIGFVVALGGRHVDLGIRARSAGR